MENKTTDEAVARIVEICRTAQNGKFQGLSTSEQLVAALVLNKPEWIPSRGYNTIPKALDRIGTAWAAAIPQAARELGLM